MTTSPSARTPAGAECPDEVYPFSAIPPPPAPPPSPSPNPDLAVNDANKVLIATAGGITAIVAAMRAHPKHADVNQYACQALANIAGNDVYVARTLSLPASTALSLTLLSTLPTTIICTLSRTRTMPLFPS